MSILKVDELQSRTSGNRITLPDVNNYPPFRNLIINGDMSIAQRGTSVSSLTTGGYSTHDRWIRGMANAGTWTQSQDTDVPTGQGFAKSLKLDCTTASASLSADANLNIGMRFEGQMLQHLKYGNSNAESLTLSFWVKSTKTGTFFAEFYNFDDNRHISKSYTISASDTWEKKTITFEGDTAGTITNDNTSSLYLLMWLVAGSNFTSGTHTGVWETTVNANRLVGQVNCADSTSNEWYITGVQLEVGDSATPFEFLPFDVNLRRCQRYLQVLGDGTPYSDTSVGGNRIAIGQRDNGSGSTAGYPIVFTQCQMRATPSITHNNVNVRQDSTNYTLSTIDTIKNFGMTIGFNIIASSALTTGETFQLRTTGGDGYIRFDAEL